jgi:hypothetical protein
MKERKERTGDGAFFFVGGGGNFGFYVLTVLILHKTSGASGGHIFLCLKKDMEERQTKGLQSRPLESGFDTGDKRSVPQGYLLRGTAADLIASIAPLRGGRHKVRPV